MEDRSARLDEITTKPFGVWLRATRLARGWTMEELADAADTAQPVVSTIERGVRNASRKMVVRLAEALAQREGDPATAQNLINSGLIAAGFTPDGFSTRKDIADDPPENFEDWPQELKEAMHYSSELTPEVQRYIYGLWRDHARAQIQIQAATLRDQSEADMSKDREK